MKKVITIKFKSDGRAYFFDPDGITADVGEKVIVETSNGLGLGTVSEVTHEVEDSEIVSPLKRVLRKANDKDLRRVEENHRLAKEAPAVCNAKLAELKLDMNLVEVVYSFDGG